MISKPEEEELFEYDSDAPGAAEHSSIQSKSKPAAKYLFAPIAFYRQDSSSEMRSTSFKEFVLKEELMKAIADLGFEHPSEGKDEERVS